MKTKKRVVQTVMVLTWLCANNLSAGEHVSPPEEFFDALTPEELQKQIQEELIEQEERTAQRAAQLADQEHQQETPSTDTTLPSDPTDNPQNTDPLSPAPTKPPETIISNKPQDPILPNNPVLISTSATQMVQESFRFVEKIKHVAKTASVQELQNAVQNYQTSYSHNVASLTPTEQVLFHPTTVLSQGIEQYKVTSATSTAFTTALTNATADHSWWDKITASTSTLEKKARARVQAGMADVTNIMQQANTLYMLLDIQQKLLTARAKLTTSPIDSTTYNQYVKQWNEKKAQFKDFFKPSSNVSRMFRSLAQTLQLPEFISMEGDIGEQITQCYDFKKAYDIYTKYYQAFGVQEGKLIGDNPNDPILGLFDFTNSIYSEIQKQIISEVNRRQAQSFWDNFRIKIQEFIGLKVSISKQLKKLNSEYLKELQNTMYNLSLLSGVFNPEHIAQLATTKSDIEAVRALANLEIKNLSITDFRRYLDYQETVDPRTNNTVVTIDTRLKDMFCPSVGTPQDVVQQYTFVRERSDIPLLKTEYVKRFIQYRLLELGKITDTFSLQDSLAQILKDNGFNIENSYNTKENLQKFLSSIIKWNPTTKAPDLTFNPENLGPVDTLTPEEIKNLDNWHNLTQAIQLWARQDIARLETILKKPQAQNVDDADLALVRSYLQLRADIVQQDTSAKEVATIYRLADMCNSLLTKGIIAQGLAGTQPVSIKPFKDNAIGMLPFFFGNPNNPQDTGGIAGMYAAIEAQYTANLLAKEQQTDAPLQKPGYKIIPYVAPLQPIPPLPTQPTNTDGGGHGHHGGEEPEEKCFDKNKKEIPCPKKDPQAQSSITR